jgi:hypothetical protein
MQFFLLTSDIDFTIDKKLEQDLWNYVFKAQINYFQSQIKENSSVRLNRRLRLNELSDQN